MRLSTLQTRLLQPVKPSRIEIHVPRLLRDKDTVGAIAYAENTDCIVSLNGWPTVSFWWRVSPERPHYLKLAWPTQDGDRNWWKDVTIP